MGLDEIQPPVDPADVRDDGELVDGCVVVMEMPQGGPRWTPFEVGADHE